MARITVEDCLNHVANRFELVHVAAVRARQLDGGYKSLLPDADKLGEKNTILALREIAEGKVDRNIIKKQNLGIFDAPDEGESMEKTLQDIAREELRKREKEQHRNLEEAKEAYERTVTRDEKPAE